MTMPSLTESLLELRAGNGVPVRVTAETRARPDHLLIGAPASAFVIPLLEAQRSGAAPEVRTLAWTLRSIGAAAAGDEGQGVVDAARRLEVPLLAPVAGTCEPQYREALAAPGRLVAACQLGDGAVGALGALMVRVSPLEAVAIACGGAIPAAALVSRTLWLLGDLPPGVHGVDAALEWARRRAREDLGASGIECVGPGAASLAPSDRVALVHVLGVAGARFAIVPSDDKTREVLRAWGRDSDWRELRAPASESEPPLEAVLDLNDLEPLVAPWSDPGLARPLRQALGRPVEGVLLGPCADESDFRTLRSWLEARGPAEGVKLVALPGTLALHAALESEGVLEALRRLGIEIPDGSTPWEPARSAGSRGVWLGLGLGERLRAAFGGRAWIANLEVCVASARAGALADPREAALDALVAEASPRPARGVAALEITTSPAAPAEPAPPAFLPPTPAGALRAPGWIDAGDDAGAERVLPHGARGRSTLTGDPREVLFAGLGPGWDEASRASSLGIVTAGRNFGGGDGADEAAWCLSRSGVRAVIARSFASDAGRALAYAGILPLESRRHPVRALATPGEELEIPSLPDSVEPGLPVGVRNLTRGIQEAMAHALDAELIAIWRRGGILAPGAE